MAPQTGYGEQILTVKPELPLLLLSGALLFALIVTNAASVALFIRAYKAYRTKKTKTHWRIIRIIKTFPHDKNRIAKHKEGIKDVD